MCHYFGSYTVRQVDRILTQFLSAKKCLEYLGDCFELFKDVPTLIHCELLLVESGPK